MTGTNKKMNKKVGRPSGINFSVIKTIKITPKQETKWNPKAIKTFLDGDIESNTLDTTILKKLIQPFIEHDIEINLQEYEINRIKQLWSDMND